MREKSETLEKLKQFLIDIGQPVSLLCGFELSTLKSDNGGEYISKAFQQFCRDKGIKHEVTPPYTPQYNGVAERYWQTMIDSARCLLKAASLPKEF
jgi:transposase InsO family protein